MRPPVLLLGLSFENARVHIQKLNGDSRDYRYPRRSSEIIEISSLKISIDDEMIKILVIAVAYF